MPSEFVEEYLECIFELTEKTGIAKTSEIADAMKVTGASTILAFGLGAFSHLIFSVF